MEVWMPDLEEIPVSLMEDVTRPPSKGRPAQVTSQIAGNLVGCIPANLGKVLEVIKQNLRSIKL